MRRLKKLGILGFVIIASAAALAQGQRPTTSDLEKSCRAYVQGFYDWYIPLLRHSKGDPSRLAVKRYRFSADLVRQLNEDWAAQAKAKGDLVGLDFDPFEGGQDVMEGRYTAGKITPKDTNYLVDISAIESGKRTTMVVAELSHEGGQWTFVNFHYGEGKDATDLLTTLKQLREDRQKYGN
jgi:hypothetical protein